MKTFTTTSTVDERFWDDMEEGYRAGYQRAINEFNDRLMTWFSVGVCVGSILGYFAGVGFFALAAVIGLAILVEKVSRIPAPKETGITS